MKYHSVFLPAITTLCLLSATSAFAAVNSKTQLTNNARWFEIEVILFKHLNKNQQHNESFNADDSSANKQAAFDLLSPYLTIDISTLQQLMPQCGQPLPVLPYNINITKIWPMLLEYPEILTTDESRITVSNFLSNDSPTMMKKVISTANEIDNSYLYNANSTITTQAYYPIDHADIKFPKYSQYPTLNKKAPCLVPEKSFTQHFALGQAAKTNSNDILIDKLVTTVNGREQWRADKNGDIIWASSKPYLISEKSLRLKSIANRIKRSRSYAPLLHLGWRQPGLSRKRATAMKLFAGENLNLKYQQALALQMSQQNIDELNAIMAQQQNHVALLSESETKSNELMSAGERSVEQSLYQQAKQQQLNDLFNEFTELSLSDTLINDGSEEVDQENKVTNQQAITELVAQLSTDMNKQVLSLIDEKNHQEQSIDIAAPIQPWSIDGFFKVHLDHYLYINSELTIIDVAKDTEAKNKITFKQNRRVISGEIHYFDHPYIGMIVQIRRFDPTKPAALAVSQNKK